MTLVNVHGKLLKQQGSVLVTCFCKNSPHDHSHHVQSTGLLHKVLPLSLFVLCCPTGTDVTSQVTTLTVCPSN